MAAAAGGTMVPPKKVNGTVSKIGDQTITIMNEMGQETEYAVPKPKTWILKDLTVHTKVEYIAKGLEISAVWVKDKAPIHNHAEKEQAPDQKTLTGEPASTPMTSAPGSAIPRDAEGVSPAQAQSGNSGVCSPSVQKSVDTSVQNSRDTGNSFSTQHRGDTNTPRLVDMVSDSNSYWKARFLADIEKERRIEWFCALKEATTIVNSSFVPNPNTSASQNMIDRTDMIFGTARRVHEWLKETMADEAKGLL